MRKKSVFMVGMPGSGKSTYLASLCCLLILQEQETAWMLDISDMPDGYEKIRKLIARLQAYQSVDRTPVPDICQMQLPLSNRHRQKVLFVIPDFSGEIFRDLVYERRLRRTVLEQLEEADTLLFFINTDTMVPETRLGVQDVSAIGRVDQEYGEEGDADRAKWAGQPPEKRSNQSAVVELLQCIAYLVRHPLHIRFIVSAWDLVEKEYGRGNIGPEEYIREKLPLLHQYVSLNPNISYEYWGASAQGGDFEDEEEVKKLQNKNESIPAYIVDRDKELSKDLTKLL